MVPILVLCPLLPSHFPEDFEVVQLAVTKKMANKQSAIVFLLLVFIPLIRNNCIKKCAILNQIEHGFQ